MALILGSLDNRNRVLWGLFPVLPQWIPEQTPVLGCSELHNPPTQLIRGSDEVSSAGPGPPQSEASGTLQRQFPAGWRPSGPFLCRQVYTCLGLFPQASQTSPDTGSRQ